jgi:hypothetical protein
LPYCRPFLPYGPVGAAVIWPSHPPVLVIAGIAIVLILGACISKDAAARRSSLALGAL